MAGWLRDESRTKKASLNAVAAALDYGTRLVIGFVITPLLVSGLGEYLYGVWQVLSRTIGYVSAASGRTPQALKVAIALQQASPNYEEKRRNVGSAVAVWLLFLPVVGALGALLAWLGPALLRTPAELITTVRLAIAVLVVDLVVTNLEDVPRAVLGGENLGYKRMGLSTALVLAGGGCTAIALYLGGGLPGVAAAQVVATLLTGLVLLGVARTYVPWFGLARPSRAAARRFLALSWWFAVWRLVMQAMMASDILVLGWLGQVEAVTRYALTKHSAETLVGMGTILVGGIAPGLGGIIGSGALKKATEVRNEMMAVTWLVATTVGSTVLLWNRDFVGLWVGPRYYAGPWETFAIVLMMTQLVMIRSDALVIDLTLNVKRKVLLGLGSALGSVALAAVLVGELEFGIVGVCVGLMAGRLALTVGYPWLLGRVLGVTLSAQLAQVIRPALTSGVLLIGGMALEETFVGETWLELGLGAGLTLALVGTAAFYAGLTRQRRRSILGRVRRLAGGTRGQTWRAGTSLPPE